MLPSVKFREVASIFIASFERPSFAAETEEIARHAQQKLDNKNCDMLCANDVSKPGSGFGSDSNQITIHKRGGEAIQLPSQSKKVAAEAILDEIVKTR